MVASERTGLYRIGGLSAILLFVSYLIITVVYVVGGPLPNGAEEWLKHIGGQTTGWWTILGLSVLTDFLFIPVLLGLYFSLKDIDHNGVIAGAGFIGFFVILDLAITWPNYSSLIILSSDYLSAVDDHQRGVSVAAAAYAHAVLSSDLIGVYIILVPSVGIFILGYIMIKSAFKKVTAYLGIVTGLLGIISVLGNFFSDAFGVGVILTSILATFWVLFVGLRLLSFSRSE